ncbi:MAG: phytanoyl-CoA dioxygenase family protein [Polyangiales bacterium]|nr:phytanoyl-CoA dioxygenase family protein [Myxococcales bacterium]
MQFTIDGVVMNYDVVGPTEHGDDYVLLDRDENLISGLPWEQTGYTVAPFLSPAENASVREAFRAIVRDMVHEAGGSTDDAFTLEQYHTYVSDDVHAGVVRQIQGRIPLDRFPVPLTRMEERISEIVERRVEMSRTATAGPAYWIRIVRPSRDDNNPLHRDVWLDRLRHNVNIYFPLAGSDANSSLCMVPGSHRWRESEITRTSAGATINGVSFSVPAVVGAAREIAATRPNPGPDEVLVFSPYLIHGGATNRNQDRTRVSLEVRFQKPGQTRES